METLKQLNGAFFMVVAYALGSFDSLLIMFLIFMGIDYLTGCIVAVLKKSPKSKNGGLSSKVGFVGICKKVTMLCAVIIGSIVDHYANLNIFRNAIIGFYCANELLSITENFQLLGVKTPKIFKKILKMFNHDDEESEV